MDQTPTPKHVLMHCSDIGHTQPVLPPVLVLLMTRIIISPR
jgi:hypothetical protein